MTEIGLEVKYQEIDAGRFNLGISPAHKGFAWINVEIFGKAAHGSKPEKGIDAIVKAGKFLNGIDKLEKNQLRQKRHSLLGSPS